MKINREMVLQSFREEADELLTQMEQSLLALEGQPENQELISSIFRVAHTLKGNASLLEFKSVAHALHSLEDLLDSLRGGTIAITLEIINLLLESVDVLRQMTGRMLAGEESLLPAHDAFFARLSQIASTAQSSEPVVSSVPPPRRQPDPMQLPPSPLRISAWTSGNWTACST